MAHSELPWLAPLLSVALLAGAAAEVRSRGRTEHAVAYHERIQAVAKATMPYSVGDWLGQRALTSPYAVALLQPNVLENWTYRNTRTGETASVLFVHCSDARDLQGHYPPACYPGQGYSTDSAVAMDWDLDGTVVHGTRYAFSRTSATDAARVVVDNFMVLPT